MFAKIFEKSFDDACYDFFIDLYVESDEVVTESQNYTTISEKTLASVTDSGKVFDQALEENIIKISQGFDR